MRSLTILILLFAQTSLGQQLAIINDPDGFVNIRDSASSKSMIVGRITDDEIFYVDEDKGEWWPVSGGFVHKSRILILEELPSLKKTFNGDGSITLRNDSIEIGIRTARFDSLKHKIKRQGIGNWVTTVDGKKPWGQDGGMPTLEIIRILFKVNGKAIEFPEELYRDFYEPNLSRINLHFASKDLWFLCMPDNSDGAGYYDAAWIIRNKKVIRRVMLQL